MGEDTDILKKARNMNANSVLIILANVLILLCSYFAKHELERLEAAQIALGSAIVPRHEIETQMNAIKDHMHELDLQVIELRSKQTSLEISVVKMQK
jgi:hypothetical protein